MLCVPFFSCMIKSCPSPSLVHHGEIEGKNFISSDGAQDQRERDMVFVARSPFFPHSLFAFSLMREEGKENEQKVFSSLSLPLSFRPSLSPHFFMSIPYISVFFLRRNHRGESFLGPGNRGLWQKKELEGCWLLPLPRCFRWMLLTAQRGKRKSGGKGYSIILGYTAEEEGEEQRGRRKLKICFC